MKVCNCAELTSVVEGLTETVEGLVLRIGVLMRRTGEPIPPEFKDLCEKHH